MTDQRLSDPLRIGIGLCCSSKSTLSMWEEVLENFSTFSSFLILPVRSQRENPHRHEDIHIQDMSCKYTINTLAEPHMFACDLPVGVSLQGWDSTPVFSGVTSCHDPFGGL